MTRTLLTIALVGSSASLAGQGTTPWSAIQTINDEFDGIQRYVSATSKEKNGTLDVFCVDSSISIRLTVAHPLDWNVESGGSPETGIDVRWTPAERGDDHVRAEVSRVRAEVSRDWKSATINDSEDSVQDGLLLYNTLTLRWRTAKPVGKETAHWVFPDHKTLETLILSCQSTTNSE